MALMATCNRCGKLADAFNRELCPEGLRWRVRCHGESIARIASHKEISRRMKDWLMIGKFADSWATFYEGGETPGGEE